MTTTKDKLPEPYYERDGITIYHADCRDILPLLEQGSVDLVLTDPPYGLEYQGQEWDRDAPLWWLNIARIIAPIVVFTIAPTLQWDYPRPDWVASYSRQGSNARNIYGGFNHWTPILIYGKTQLSVDFERSNPFRNPTNGHPSPKPESIFRWLIGMMSNRNDLVLDPFMGSGTTLRAALDLGRRAIGIEIEEKYCAIAVERLRQRVLI